MKFDKKKLSEELLEGLLEIILSLVFFGIGAFIVSLFGVKIDFSELDGDLIILLGILVFAVVFGGIYALVRYFNKRSTKRKNK